MLGKNDLCPVRNRKNAVGLFVTRRQKCMRLYQHGIFFNPEGGRRQDIYTAFEDYMVHFIKLLKEDYSATDFTKYRIATVAPKENNVRILDCIIYT